MKVWRQADLAERSRDIFEAAFESVPQEVNLGEHGAAMVVPYREWARLKAMEARVAAGETDPSFHEWLFAPEPIFDIEFDQSFLDREPPKRREPPDFSDE